MDYFESDFCCVGATKFSRKAPQLLAFGCMADWMNPIILGLAYMKFSMLNKFNIFERRNLMILSYFYFI